MLDMWLLSHMICYGLGFFFCKGFSRIFEFGCIRTCIDEKLQDALRGWMVAISLASFLHVSFYNYRHHMGQKGVPHQYFLSPGAIECQILSFYIIWLLLLLYSWVYHLFVFKIRSIFLLFILTFQIYERNLKCKFW